MARFTQEHLSRIDKLTGTDPRAAFELLRAYEIQFSHEQSYRSRRGALQIDIGSGLGDANVVRAGIEAERETLTRASASRRASHLYNVANGFSALHFIARRQRGFVYNPDDTPLTDAKRFFRKAIACVKRDDPKEAAKVHVNYGNCLSQLGRTVEAIHEYDEALRCVPDHPMAWANLGIELNHFSYFADVPHLFTSPASAALHKALEGNRLEEQGKPRLRSRLEVISKQIDARDEEMRTLFAGVRVKQPSFNSRYQQRYADFCAGNDLFLNLSVGGRPCYAAFEDSMMLRTVALPIKDVSTFPRLVRAVNALKEQYASARLILYEALVPPHRLSPYDKMTHYSDTLDHGVYGIAPGKLKVAFESCYNVLDKIAFFLNVYLKLGISERRVDFLYVWRSQCNGSLRSAIGKRRNYQLFALYDLARDLSPDGELAALREMRDFLTHRYVVPHAESSGRVEWEDDRKYHLSLQELRDQTLTLMRLVRSAVIYLITSVQWVEQEKWKEIEGEVGYHMAFDYRPIDLEALLWVDASLSRSRTNPDHPKAKHG